MTSRRAYYAAYSAAHRQEKRAHNAAYKAAHRVEIAARGRAHYAAHREKELARVVAYNEGHPEEYRSGHAARHAARKFGERVPLGLWRGVWSGACFGCGKQPAEGVDHIIPRSKGGRNVVENLQPACWPCNQRKGARLAAGAAS